MLKDKLMQLPVSDFGVLEISFDETETPVGLQTKNERAHIIMLHAVLTCRVDGNMIPHEIVVAPGIIETTSAEYLAGAIEQRLPFKIKDIAAKCSRNLVIVFNTDSAASCVRLTRALGGLPAVCRMHQL